MWFTELLCFTSPYCQAVSPEARRPVFGPKMCTGSETDREKTLGFYSIIVAIQPITRSLTTCQTYDCS